ncbi:hypothetical protein ACSHWB_17935 [Lentzea sp. HUAS TT2]|uniref:hypothetical protein n=1 Tax=Lentzea sp. HUAS TT2 TaxID=3447454 RepID=UPI003F6F124D
MPRRRPLTARALVQHPEYPFSVVRGMSSRLLGDIRRLEETRPDFWQRSVEASLWTWVQHLQDPRRHLRDYDNFYGCGVYECCANPLEARHLLRKAVSALPPPSAKELRRFVATTAERHAV